MGTKYGSGQSATGYNSSPPSDDGTASEANKGKWSTIKTKLGDPVKNLADAMNTALVTALNVDCTVQTATYSTAATDHLKPILCSGTFTVSLGDAVTMAVGYQATVVNVGTGVITVGLVTNTDTLNGTANGTIKLAAGHALTAATNSSPNGYNVISGFGAKVKTISFTRNTATATGTQAVTGAGGKPKGAVFFATVSSSTSASWGMDDVTTAMCIYQGVSSGTFVSAATGSSIVSDQSGGNVYSGLVQSFDADGFTISWTKTSSPGGTLTVVAALIM